MSTTRWNGFAIKANFASKISSLKLRVLVTSSGSVTTTLYLYAATSSGVPTGSALASQDFTNTVSASVPATWTLSPTSFPSLSAGSSYAILMKGTSSGMLWYIPNDTTAASSTGWTVLGWGYTSDSGSTWNGFNNGVLKLAAYLSGSSPPPPPPPPSPAPPPPLVFYVGNTASGIGSNTGNQYTTSTTRWNGFSFKVNFASRISSLKLRVLVTSSGSVTTTLYMYAATSSGVPTGSSLASQSFSNTVSASVPATWTLSPTSFPSLSAGNTYAVLLKGTGTNVYWYIASDTAAADSTGWTYKSWGYTSDSGSTWTGFNNGVLGLVAYLSGTSA
ncbi:hypothetical protein ABPG75_009245 [Micractinium tetrahymenae]